MNFIIKSKSIKINSQLREYIKERIGSCEKYINSDLPIIVNVEIEKTTSHHTKGKIFRAEANMKFKSKLLRAEATREDIYLAINEVRDNLKREIKKYKEIIIEKHRRTKKGVIKNF